MCHHWGKSTKSHHDPKKKEENDAIDYSKFKFLLKS